MTNGTKSIRINDKRLLSRLGEMAQLGATQNGGVCREALTDEDRAGRDLFVRWCQEAGFTVIVDQIGNIFARRRGTADDLPAVLTGSHLDSQPTGGKYDGVYGVLAALEVIESLNDEGITTRHPLEIVSWTNEEGARFAPGLTGSGVFTGAFDIEQELARTDKNGYLLGEELQRIGYAGDAPVGGREFKAALEIHIEQGPILESEAATIGVVNGIQGLRWYDIIFEGQESHAGTTPMAGRRDPVMGAIKSLERIYALVDDLSPDGRATFGDFIVEPGSRNTVPGRLTVTLDFRHPHANILDATDHKIRSVVESECKSRNLDGRVKQLWYMPPVSFAEECIKAINYAVDILGENSLQMLSGAGHDALYLSQVMPTGMIFVPSENGLSHNELEYTRPEDLITGANVLLHALLSLANN